MKLPYYYEIKQNQHKYYYAFKCISQLTTIAFNQTKCPKYIERDIVNQRII